MKLHQVLFALTILLVSHSAYADEDYFSGLIKYMDKLKTCTAYNFTYPHPVIKGAKGANIIKGKKGDICQVTLLFPGDIKMECQYTPETIRLLTTEEMYKQAREKRITASTKDPAVIRSSQECKMQ